MPTFNATGDENAIVGAADKGMGVHGTSRTGRGVVGLAQDATAVEGWCEGSGIGVFGSSKTGRGVVGLTTTNATAVEGRCEGSGISVFGSSKTGRGVVGVAEGNATGVEGRSEGSGAGVYGSSKSGPAGHFAGNVHVTGEIHVEGDIKLVNADCAEDFDVCESPEVEPGTVMVLGEEGVLYPSHQPYDKKVVGVVSGAGSYQPGIVFDKQHSQTGRMPIALLGKVFCKVDAQHSPIEVGDLLTTSATPGCAMKANDHDKAFGSVIGKALRPLKAGIGIIPIVIALQ